MAQAQTKQKTNAEKLEEAQNLKAISDANNSDLSKKKTQMEVADTLEMRILKLKTEIQNLINELETKQKACSNVNDEILASNSSLARAKERFEKDNAARIKALSIKQKEIETSNAEYKTLLLENKQKQSFLNSELAKILEERKEHKGQMNTMTKNHEDIIADVAKREADLAAREAEHKKAKEEFEAYKTSLEPEFAKISSILNENKNLLQEIDSQKIQTQGQYASFEKERARAEDDKTLERERIKQLELKCQNELVRLRKWEEDMKDSDMALQIREKEVEKLKERYQLKEKYDKLDSESKPKK